MTVISRSRWRISIGASHKPKERSYADALDMTASQGQHLRSLQNTSSAAISTASPSRATLQVGAALQTNKTLSQEGNIIGIEQDTGELGRIQQAATRQGCMWLAKMAPAKRHYWSTSCCEKSTMAWVCFIIDPHGDAINDVLRLLPQEREKTLLCVDSVGYQVPLWFECI